MNNMKYCNDSLAHDYDLFMPKRKNTDKAEKEKIINMPRSQVKQKAQEKKSFVSRIFPVVTAIFIVGALFGNLFIRAEISKIGNEINKAETVCDQLKSEQTRLSVELEKKTSVGNLEKQAQKLGMQKQERVQMNYIFTNSDKQEAETADAK